MEVELDLHPSNTDSSAACCRLYASKRVKTHHSMHRLCFAKVKSAARLAALICQSAADDITVNALSKDHQHHKMQMPACMLVVTILSSAVRLYCYAMPLMSDRAGNRDPGSRVSAPFRCWKSHHWSIGWSRGLRGQSRVASGLEVDCDQVLNFWQPTT